MEIENRIIVEIVFKVAAILILLTSAFEDQRKQRISILFPLAELVLSLSYSGYLWTFGEFSVKTFLLDILPGVMMLMVSVITGMELGTGDGLMALTIGPLFGFCDISVAIMLSFLFSSAASIVLLLSKRVSLKSHFAFLPYLTMGVGVMCFATI